MALHPAPPNPAPSYARRRVAPARATSGSTLTSWVIVSSVRRILGKVIRFICGHRLQGRTNSSSGYCNATLSLIEHSVSSTTLGGRFLPTKSAIAAVEPEEKTEGRGSKPCVSAYEAV